MRCRGAQEQGLYKEIVCHDAVRVENKQVREHFHKVGSYSSGHMFPAFTIRREIYTPAGAAANPAHLWCKAWGWGRRPLF